MAEDSKKAGGETVLPYIAFKTVGTLRDRMVENGVPNRVDKSYLDNFSGGYQTQVLAALLALGLIKPDQSPSDDLKEYVAADLEGQKAVMERLVRAKYEPILTLELNTTNAQLIEAFGNMAPQVTGDTRRKAIAFFLNACKFAEIPVGKNWRTPAVSSGGTTKRKPKGKPDPKVDTVHDDDDDEPTFTEPLGEKKVIDLGDAGSITVYVDVKWLQLSTDKFTKLRTALDKLDEIAPAGLPAAADDDDDDLILDDDEGDES